MKQNFIFGIIALTIFILIISCSQKVEIPKEPIEFDIYYSFGVHEDNILDTKNNIYAKDMVCEPPKEYILKLNESDKAAIYNAIMENDLLNIKDDFTESCYKDGGCVQSEPPYNATLKIFINGKTKTIKWRTEYNIIHLDDPELEKLMNVRNAIENIISQKEKEMNIEQPKCFYF